MRTVIITIVLLTAINVNSQVNKFIFASGMDFNVWNKDMLNGNLIYINRCDDSNYALYMEAQRVVEENGFDFSNPTSRVDITDGFVTLTNIIYENVPFGSNARSEFVYENNIIKIWVVISEKGSKIVMYDKK